MRKILHLLPELNPGGVEWAVIDLVKSLTNYQCLVASNNGKLINELNKANIKHFLLPLNSKNPYQILKNTQNLQQIIINEKVDLIHVHSRAPAWSGVMLSKKSSIPMVTTYHGAYKQNNILKKWYNSSMVRGEAIIAISQFIYNHVLHYYPSVSHKLHLIYEGIDINYFNPQDVDPNSVLELKNKWLNFQDKKIILLSGRFTNIKGHKLLLQSLKYISQPVKVIFWGPPPSNLTYQTELKNYIQAHGLDVEIVEEQIDARVVYMAADLVVCPSIKAEAFGRVTAEAMAMEKVVVGFNHGATTELLSSDSLALVNDVNSLARIINQAFNNAVEEGKKIGIANRKKIVDCFDKQKMCSSIENLYNKL